jgi:hypothetical protein
MAVRLEDLDWAGVLHGLAIDQFAVEVEDVDEGHKLAVLVAGLPFDGPGVAHGVGSGITIISLSTGDTDEAGHPAAGVRTR